AGRCTAGRARRRRGAPHGRPRPSPRVCAPWLPLESQSMGWQYQLMEQLSGVGVLDKAAMVLAAVERGPASLAELVTRTGLTRATAHRLASALEVHRLVGRDGAGRFVAGPRLAAGVGAPLPWELADRADRVLTELRDRTGESTQLYVRRGALRLCVAASERASGLRDTVPVGAVLPM